jgi:hypothetical protein
VQAHLGLSPRAEAARTPAQPGRRGHSLVESFILRGRRRRRGRLRSEASQFQDIPAADARALTVWARSKPKPASPAALTSRLRSVLRLIPSESRAQHGSTGLPRATALGWGLGNAGAARAFAAQSAAGGAKSRRSGPAGEHANMKRVTAKGKGRTGGGRGGGEREREGERIGRIVYLYLKTAGRECGGARTESRLRVLRLALCTMNCVFHYVIVVALSSVSCVCRMTHVCITFMFMYAGMRVVWVWPCADRRDADAEMALSPYIADSSEIAQMCKFVC